MNSILDKIVEHKRGEIERAKQQVSISQLEQICQQAEPPRCFLSPLWGDGVSLIAEVKRASPSAGLIRQDFDPVGIAAIYADNGASCISVLTDSHFFQGDLQFLVDIRAAVSIPLLRKDFVLDPYQVYEARAAGADAVLLIAECLSPAALRDLYQLVEELGMVALVELYERSNLETVLACQPKLVGVNNRNLKNFQTDLGHSLAIRKQVPEEILFVSESGIYTHEDVTRLESAGVDAMLVGESLMRADDIGAAVRSLLRHD